MKRWIDLSAHDMRLKLAILPNASVLVLENGDANEAAAKALGFTRRPTGAWVRANSVDANPREFMRVLPKTVVREMDPNEYILRPPAPSQGPTPSSEKGLGAAAVAVSVPQTGFVGINRFGQEVRQTEDGERFLVDNRGRRTFERHIATPMPGLFLRALDEGSLALCAEGFIEHCLSAGKFGKPDIAAFANVIGSSEHPVSLAQIEAALTVAHERILVKKSDISLRDRFGKAVDIATVLPLRAAADAPLGIAIRRMLGNGPEMLGRAVALNGRAARIISGLMPKGARLIDDPAGADVVVDIASSEGEAFATLSRGSNSRRIIVIPVAVPGAASTIPAAVANSHRVEAACHLSAEAGGPALVLVVGSKLEPGDQVQAPHVASIAGYGELWTWATDVAMARARLETAIKSGLVTDAELTSADPSMIRNDFQVPYASASKVGTPVTMVPKNLDGPSRQALDKAVAAFGDFDRKVALEFGFAPEKLGDVLAPEQIDALGLYLHAEQRGRDAFLVADGAGVGKGRTLAAVAKRAVMQKRKVIFLTEKEINLGDFHRDIVHIGADDIVRPYVLNDGASLIDERTGKEFEVGDPAVLKQAIKDGVWPEGVDVIYATYSQFNRLSDESERVRWLEKVVDDEVTLLEDEAHNAAGDSNIGENLRRATRNAGYVVFSSATYAATAKSMGFYERLFPEGLSEDEINAIMRKGGEEMQEVVSTMLVADGVMVRREQDLSQFEFVQVMEDEAGIQRNRKLMDQLASVITEMAALSGELDAWITVQNGDQQGEQRDNDRVRKLQISRMSFGSPLYTLTRVFCGALLTDLAANRAIEALRNGEKPVILTENTLEAILKETPDGEVPDFRAVVHRILNQMLSARTVDGIGVTERVEIDVEQAGVSAAVARIREMIDLLPPLPASAIDEIRSRIEEAGFSCGEITGRSVEIRNGKVVNRSNRNRIKTKNDFNSGNLDALIINVAGSTGIDMHAGRRFKDKRRRVMIEHQGPSHVTRQIQAYFRVGRRDQENTPKIEMLSSGLPSEIRLAAMRNQKLRRLSANVSSNRDNAFLSRNIPDLLNKVGDTVIGRYAEMRPDLIERLHLDLGQGDEETANEAAAGQVVTEEKASDRIANEFLARLMLLPTAAQEKILDELTNEYLAHVAELEAKGENPLRTKEVDGIVHVRRSSLYEGGSITTDGSSFDGPLHLLDVMIERTADPISAELVMEAVDRGSAEQGRVLEVIDALEGNAELFLEPFLPRKARSVDEAIAQGSKRIMGMRQQMDDLVQVLKQLAPGRSIPTPEWMAEPGTRAIVTSITAPPPGFEHVPSLYVVEIAAPGAVSLQRFKLDTLVGMAGLAVRENGALRINVQEGLEGNDYDAILESFENAVAKRMTPSRILTTNIFRAVRLATEHKLGSLVSFIDENGVRNRGVLVKKDFENKLEAMALRVDGVEGSMHVLTKLRAEIGSVPGGGNRGILITPVGKDSWAVRLPGPARRRGDDVWPSDGYRSAHGKGVIDPQGRSRINIEGEHALRDLLQVLAEAGIGSYYASSKHRDLMRKNDEAASVSMRRTA